MKRLLYLIFVGTFWLSVSFLHAAKQTVVLDYLTFEQFHALAGKPFEKSVTLKKGDKLVLSFESNPSTGYQWSVVDKASSVGRLIKDQFIADRHPEKDWVGGGGKQLYTFKACKCGTATLEFAYRRSWQESKPAERTVKIQVTVEHKNLKKDKN